MLVVQEPLHSDNHIVARCARWRLRIPRNRLSLQQLLNLCLYSLRSGVTSEIQPTCFLVFLFSFGDSGEEHASSLIQLLAEFSSCGCRTGFLFPFWLSAWSCSQPWRLLVFLPLGPLHLQSQQRRSTSTLELPVLPTSDFLLLCNQPEKIYYFSKHSYN